MDKVEVLRRYRDCIDVWCSLVEEEKRLRYEDLKARLEKKISV